MKKEKNIAPLVGKPSSTAGRLDKIISLCKRRGFIFQSSEEYGGAAAAYDYGPLGVELKNNIKDLWFKEMTRLHRDIVGLDAAILMNPKVWEASGHVENFTDPLVECKNCHQRFRADHVLELNSLKPRGGKEKPAELKEMVCPECGGELTQPRQFNLMFKTHLGSTEETARDLYLRPETAQGIYVDFKRVQQSMRLKIPFGIAQIGKAFRNEISPGDFTYRTVEFEQMEMQWFCHSLEADKWFEYWKEERLKWYLNLGLKKENLRFHEHGKKELAHYAKKAFDIEYKFPFGWKEIEGIHHRGDWDLSRHAKFSGHDLRYADDKYKEPFFPYIIETSGGVDRAALVFLSDAYEEIAGGRTTTTESVKEEEVVLKLPYELAPVKVAILPLSKKEPLVKIASEIEMNLRKHFVVQYDETGSIGKRYRRQDEIGTPFCVTVDFDSVEDKKVTVRDRDTMKQERIEIVKLNDFLKERFEI